MHDANGVELHVGSVVQIDPAHDEKFGGCFMLVTELKGFGALGFVEIPGDDGGQAYYRCPHDAMVLIGSAEWAPAELEEQP